MHLQDFRRPQPTTVQSDTASSARCWRNLLAIVACFFWIAAGSGQEIAIDPTVVRQGEVVRLLAMVKDCSGSSPKLDTAKPERYEIQISGSGINLDPKSFLVSDCSISVSAEIEKTARFGDRRVILLDKDQKKTLQAATVEVVDLEAGPIPAGLKPQVDVMWNILSEWTCEDHFGSRVSSRYYCIEVQIGNNTGYALLLAGIGFRRDVGSIEYREGNSSYVQVRSVLQKEQVLSSRNITLRSLQAAGLVVAGFIPFSGNAGRRGRIGIWSTLVGNVLAGAYENFWPDRTVRQIVNLDDAALRDSRLIPNNSPAKFTVFVDRDTILPLLASPPCAGAYRLGVWQQALKRDEQELKLAARSDAPTETDEILAKKSQEIKTASSLIDDLPEAVKPCVDFKIPTKKNKLNFLGRPRAELEGDLIAVRQALGDLVIVGDQIEFKQRLRVDSSAEAPEILQSPIIQGIVGNAHLTQGSTVASITLTGRLLKGAVVTTPECSAPKCRIESTSQGADGQTLTLLNISLSGDYTSDTLMIVVSNGSSSSVAFAIPVRPAAPVLNEPDPGEVEIVENEAQGVTIPLRGEYLIGGEARVAVRNASGLIGNEVFVPYQTTDSKAARITVQLTAAQAKAGARIEVIVERKELKSKVVKWTLKKKGA
ncbi:MAG: hypothetical protein KIT83_04910 [Bryobacterales bacterium]|nr:hypothetical protein [Bryobacterales bacterium]